MNHEPVAPYRLYRRVLICALVNAACAVILAIALIVERAA